MNTTSAESTRRREDHRENATGRFGTHNHPAAANVVLTKPGGHHGFCDECGGDASSDSFLCRSCEQTVPQEKFFDEGPAPQREYEDPCPGKEGTDREWVDCKRCGGRGTMSEYQDSFDGECFECHGSKGAHTLVSVIRRRARDQVRRDNKASADLHERRILHNTNYRRAIEINPAAEGWVDAFGEDRFLSDLWEKAFRFELSDKQLAAIGATFDRRTARTEAVEAEKAAAVPVPEGKNVVTGEVLSLKYEDNQYGYGSVAKMTVKDERGFKVYGTAPAKLIDEATGPLEGTKISFTATLKPGREKGFGFFSRPTKAAAVTD